MVKGDKPIKALDDNGQPRPVTGYGAWNPWRSPADWTADRIAELGHRPGVYMLRAIESANRPVEFQAALGTGGSGAAADDLARRAARLQGVLYVGKAVDLTHRFGILATSWQTDPPTPGHTSARNYFRKDAVFQQQFPARKVELTCMAIGPQDWTDKVLADGLLGLPQCWFWKHYPQWTQGHGNAEMDRTVAATIDTERSLLCLYRMVFGDFPPLNRRTPNCIGARLDDEWLESLFEHETAPANHAAEADDAVEMGDPNRPEVRRVIEADRQRRDQSHNA